MKEQLTQSQLEKLVREAADKGGIFMERLIKIAEPKVSSFMLRMTFNTQAAEDLRQEVLMSIVVSISKLRQPEKFWGWVYSICSNKLKDHLRKKKKQQYVNFCQVDGLIGKFAEKNSPAPSIHCQANESSEKLRESISQLKSKHQQLIQMRYYQNLPYSEISSQLQCSETCARVTLSRVKTKLKERFLAKETAAEKAAKLYKFDRLRTLTATAAV